MSSRIIENWCRIKLHPIVSENAVMTRSNIFGCCGRIKWYGSLIFGIPQDFPTIIRRFFHSNQSCPTFTFGQIEIYAQLTTQGRNRNTKEKKRVQKNHANYRRWGNHMGCWLGKSPAFAVEFDWFNGMRRRQVIGIGMSPYPEHVRIKFILLLGNDIEIVFSWNANSKVVERIFFCVDSVKSNNFLRTLCICIV